MADLDFEVAFPGYWQHETTGVLRPAVEAYLSGVTMTGEQIAAMRAYLRQWVACPVWKGPEVERLRRWVEDLNTRQGIAQWLVVAELEGIDPL